MYIFSKTVDFQVSPRGYNIWEWTTRNKYRVTHGMLINATTARRNFIWLWNTQLESIRTNVPQAHAHTHTHSVFFFFFVNVPIISTLVCTVLHFIHPIQDVLPQFNCWLKCSTVSWLLLLVYCQERYRNRFLHWVCKCIGACSHMHVWYLPGMG